MQNKKILIAPLNWGLGHATRCIPIINELHRQGAEVILASDGVALDLLKSEFPSLKIHQLPAYNIRYPYRNMMLSMATQMPKILRGAIAENCWLKNYLKENSVFAVISDNRFGFYNRKVKSIFITHQVNIKIPIALFQPLVNKINHYFIKKFDECWIPDFANEPNLAGHLSHGIADKQLKIKYLGVLSRMKYFAATQIYRAIAVLSGPEPQRTNLENIILKQFKEIVAKKTPAFEPRNTEIQLSETQAPPQYFNKFILVRGVTSEEKSDFSHTNIEIHNYLKTNDLNQKILESNLMICRSGYSTVMDLVNLKSRAILIPTPGQTEQEYLAEGLTANQSFYSQLQDDLNLEKALEQVPHFKGFDESFAQNDFLKEIISELLNN